MDTNAATTEDFDTWERKARNMTMAQLVWSRTDAIEAARAVETFDPSGAGRYIDEACTYGREIARRGGVA